MLRMANIIDNKAKPQLDKIIDREVPSQLPMNVTKSSYARMLKHCKTEFGVWACRKNGARVNARGVWMNVFDRKTGQLLNARIPVVHLFCSGCDKAPKVNSGDPIYADQLQTVSV